MSELGHVVGRPWKPCQSATLLACPVALWGSRTAFSHGFLKDLAETWRDKGKQAMNWTAHNQPAVFFATCARLIGPEVKLTIEQTLPGNLSMEDWQTEMSVHSNMHNDTINSPQSELPDFAALLAQTHGDGAHQTAHDAIDVTDHAATLAAQHAHHFLV